MSTNQARKGKVKPCPNGCGVDIFFESRFGEDGNLILKKDSQDARWWMMEDVSKQQHNCAKKGIKSDTIPMRESGLKDQSLLDTTAQTKPHAKEMDVADVAESRLRVDVRINLKVLSIIEDEILKFLRNKGISDPSPAYVGMLMKLLMGMNK